MQSSNLPRANVLGVGVSAINMEQAVLLFDSWLSNGGRGYVCVTGVHGVMEAQRDSSFRQILNGALLTAPDGMPTVWVGKLQGFSKMDRVFGPDLMTRVCELSCRRGYTHFLYGGQPGIVAQLNTVLTARFPGLKVVDTYTPPFRPLNNDEEQDLLHRVSRVKPDVFWVGLSTPKQERFMAEYANKIDAKIMVGVGAAFDYHTGLIKDSPQWLKKVGMQWLHRLGQEPARLWKRYLINNPSFLWKISLQLLGVSKYTINT
jgi:N-acetylglucosaminyldiphosphoundecaprenol N-acetyl-beta-D-mannosaminyltransferase